MAALPGPACAKVDSSYVAKGERGSGAYYRDCRGLGQSLIPPTPLSATVMRLFRAFGLILFLVAAKTFLLATPYQDFQRTLSQFFRTLETGLIETESLLENDSSIDLESVNQLVASPIINFSTTTQ